ALVIQLCQRSVVRVLTTDMDFQAAYLLVVFGFWGMVCGSLSLRPPPSPLAERLEACEPMAGEPSEGARAAS
ncbi:MAG: hypothetical protein NTW83_09865, partial [Cyanobacteria bacterium]|nr:hypothetical protein [Cyanobacteriota bacterium]